MKLGWGGRRARCQKRSPRVAARVRRRPPITIIATGLNKRSVKVGSMVAAMVGGCCAWAAAEFVSAELVRSRAATFSGSGPRKDGCTALGASVRVEPGDSDIVDAFVMVS